MSSGVIASGGSLENGYNQRFHSASQLPLNAFIDDTIFRSISNNTRGASAVPRFHPHSLPEYCDGLANGSPYNLSNTIKMAANIGTGSAEASDGRHIQGMGSTGNLADFNAGGKFNMLWIIILCLQQFQNCSKSIENRL